MDKAVVIRKVYHALFAFFVFSIPLSQRISAVALILLVITTPFVISARPFAERVRVSRDLLLFFLILAIGLWITTDQEQGLRVLETSLSLLALPFVIGFFRNDLDLESQLFFPFTMGLWLAGGICLVKATTGFLAGEGLPAFFFERFTSVLDVQPTYMAYYLIFGITCGFYLMFYGQRKAKRFTKVTVVFLYGLLLLTGGQTTLIGLQLILGFFLLKFLVGEREQADGVAFSLVVAMMIAGFVFALLIRNYPELDSVSNQTDYWERWSLWEAGFNAHQGILFGVGTGDYNLVLNAYYREHDLANLAARNTNAHNQYIQTFFMNGLIGLTSLLVILFRPLYLYAKRGIPLGILIMFPFVVYGITEVFLGRYQGVVFFALLHQLTMARYYVEEKNITAGALDRL